MFIPNHALLTFTGHEDAQPNGLTDIFRCNYEALVDAAITVHLPLSCKLYATGWISRSTKNSCASASAVSPEQAATSIINELETALYQKSNTEKALDDLCSCLLEVGTIFKPVVKRIRGKTAVYRHIIHSYLMCY